MMSNTLLFTYIFVLLQALEASCFLVYNPQSVGSSQARHTIEYDTNPTAFWRTKQVLNAGFGGDSKKKKEPKIKPKQQWDRYTGDLKKEKPFRVAVKAEGTANDQWLEVGNVKSKGGEYTKAAVARQRALIVEHARRLFPLQVSPKDKMEWAYWDMDTDEWILVDKSVLEVDGIPDSLEKLIGFEGRPDPASGFYCMYNEGKLVNSEDDMKRKTSRKLQ